MTRKGLTLIELLLVFSLVAILATGAFVSFWGTKSNQALSASADTLQTILNRARIYSRDGRDEKAWGVIKNNSQSYDLVKGNPENVVFVQRFGLESPTKFKDLNFNVWFNPGTGSISSEVDIVLYNPRGSQISVMVTPTGLVNVRK